MDRPLGLNRYRHGNEADPCVEIRGSMSSHWRIFATRSRCGPQEDQGNFPALWESLPYSEIPDCIYLSTSTR
jgi:hypothetical protein